MLKTLIFVYAMVAGTLGTSVVGSVKDNESKDNLAYVQIVINQTDTIYTDDAGNFKYLIEDELKSVELNLPGYETKKYIYVEDEVEVEKKGIRLFKKKDKGD